MDTSALFLFLVSTGMPFAALRSRHRMGPNYSVRFLYNLAGIDFALAAGFFWYAADHRSSTGTVMH